MCVKFCEAEGPLWAYICIQKLICSSEYLICMYVCGIKAVWKTNCDIEKRIL